MKLSLFQKFLEEKEYDLALFADEVTITYFTQMKPSPGLLAITPQEAILFLTALDKKPDHFEVHELKKWKEELASGKPFKVGINKEKLSVREEEELRKIFPKAQFEDVSGKLQELRSQKTDREIRLIAKACSITSCAYTNLLVALEGKKLKTEMDVALCLERSMREQGGGVAFPTIAASGFHAAIPHHITSTQKLRSGFLVVDFGASYKNYCADMTRVVHLGHISSSARRNYQLLFAAQQGAINAVKENRSFQELDQMARALLGKYSRYFVHSLGHGIGVEVHEAPVFTHSRIRKNQVFTIEPGIYVPGKFGLRIEDTLLFNGKTRILTTASRDLQVFK